MTTCQNLSRGIVKMTKRCCMFFNQLKVGFKVANFELQPFEFKWKFFDMESERKPGIERD